MFFLFPRWDMLVSWRVSPFNTNNIYTMLQSQGRAQSSHGVLWEPAVCGATVFPLNFIRMNDLFPGHLSSFLLGWLVGLQPHL